MQDNALLLDTATAQSSSSVLDDAALLATASAITADMLTPADRGPGALFSEASLLDSSKEGNHSTEQSFLCFAPSERYSDEGALLTPVQMLTNRVLSEQPALNNAMQRGNQLVEGASEVVAQATTFTKGVAAETVQDISESAREWLRTAEDAWLAPDNATRIALRQRADRLADGVGDLIKGIDDSDRMKIVRSYWQKASEAFNNLTNSLYSELGYVETTTANTADSALEKAEQRLRENLTELRLSDRFEKTVNTALGQVDTQTAQSVVDSFISGESVPEITVVEANVLKGDAAFGDNTIFVSESYLTQNSENPDAIDAVLLEEAGHYFDKTLNTTDAAGDEGNIFARLALGEVLSAEVLQQLKLEDDRSTIAYNGQYIEVENFWDSISSGFDSFTSTVSDYASSSYDTVSDYASDTYDTVSDYASDTFDRVRDYASFTYDTVSDYASSSYDTACDYASDTYDTVSDYASDTYDTVSDYASSTYDAVSDYASDTYDTVSDYASSTYDAVSDYASDTYDTVSDYASNTYDSVSDFASNTYDMVSDYASDTYDTVSDYTSAAYDTVTDFASDTYDTAVDYASDTYDTVTDFAADTYDAAVDTFDTVTETVTDTVVDTYDSGVEMATEAVDDLTTFASDSYDAVTDSLSNAWDTAVETVDDVGEALVDAKDATVEFVTEDAPEWIAETAIDVKDATVEFVTEDVPEWIAENETTVNRVVGGVQAVGGVGEMVVGAALVPTGAASFGAGTVAGGVVMAHGADTTWAGLKALWTGESQETYTQQGVTAIADAIPGVETDTAESIGMWTDLGLGIAGPLGAARAITSSADNVITGVTDNVVANSLDNVATPALDEVAVGAADNVATGALDDTVDETLEGAASTADEFANGAGNGDIPDVATSPDDSPFYEVGFEAQLEAGRDFPGVSDRRHFQESNRQLHEAMQVDADFAQGMEDLYPGITEGVAPGSRGAYPRRAPTSATTWHHEPYREGAMQLVPRSQHTAPGPVQNSLHPDGRGGMQNWGGGR